jgi:hypothetical protein
MEHHPWKEAFHDEGPCWKIWCFISLKGGKQARPQEIFSAHLRRIYWSWCNCCSLYKIVDWCDDGIFEYEKTKNSSSLKASIIYVNTWVHLAELQFFSDFFLL